MLLAGCWHNGWYSRRCMCCRLIYISCILTIELQRGAQWLARMTEPRPQTRGDATTLELHHLPTNSPPTSRAPAHPLECNTQTAPDILPVSMRPVAKRRCCVAAAPAGVAPTSDLSHQTVQLQSVYTCRASGGTVSLQHGACEAWHGGVRTSKPSARRHFL
jgi:hypothetical protein